MTEQHAEKQVRDIFQTREGKLIVYQDGREELTPHTSDSEPQELPVPMYKIDSGEVATPKYPHP
jgi:hypothetical protein